MAGQRVPCLLGVKSIPERLPTHSEYPFHLPFVRTLNLTFREPVCFFVGENGTGKSTLIEALANLCGFPVWGGGSNDLTDRYGPESESKLSTALRSVFRQRPRDGFFFRAEFQAQFASLLDERRNDPDFPGDPYKRYGVGLFMPGRMARRF